MLGCVLDRFGLDEAIVSERDILHGAALRGGGIGQPVMVAARPVSASASFRLAA